MINRRERVKNRRTFMKKWMKKNKNILAMIIAIFLAALLLLGSLAGFFM